MRGVLNSARVLTILLVSTALTGCREMEVLASEADATVSDLTCEGDAKLVDGELDAGILLAFTVENRGKRGRIQVLPWLSSSEGEWSRSQSLEFEQNESRRLEYFFQEPTINAANVNCEVKVFPSKGGVPAS